MAVLFWLNALVALVVTTMLQACDDLLLELHRMFG